jgi:hypothetical protein
MFLERRKLKNKRRKSAFLKRQKSLLRYLEEKVYQNLTVFVKERMPLSLDVKILTPSLLELI